MRIRTFSLVAGMAAATVMCLSTTSVSRAADDAVSSGDKHFVMSASQANMTEIASAKAALATTSNDEVKKFAQKMVDDHTKAGDELMSWAKSKNLEVPATLDDKHEKMVDDLKGKTGSDFDKAYAEMMVKDHGKVINMFEKESARGDDSSLKEWASKTLPTLQEHQTEATALAAAVGVKADDKDMGGMHDMGGDKK